jgi:mannose-1-phosphate guanylyltransferase
MVVGVAPRLYPRSESPSFLDLGAGEMNPMDLASQDPERNGSNGVGRLARPDWWGVVLAGGDGTRLRDLTRQMTGDDRPKQFCALIGAETLLEATRRRIALAIAAPRTLFSVTQAHARFYAPVVSDGGPRQLVMQPDNRGTAPAILYALLRIAAIAPFDAVVIFPSDHYVSDDAAFMAHVETALELAVARPDLVVLLGIPPDRPEPAYGWIEPTEPILGSHQWPAHRVGRFWEKPAPDLAESLWAAGCLWNSFVVVGRVLTLLGLLQRTIPACYHAFSPVRQTLGSPAESDAVRAVYAELPATDFSHHVLGRNPANLAVLPVRGVSWQDLGDPRRIQEIRRRVMEG